jgi:hypothetical protein
MIFIPRRLKVGMPCGNITIVPEYNVNVSNGARYARCNIHELRILSRSLLIILSGNYREDYLSVTIISATQKSEYVVREFENASGEIYILQGCQLYLAVILIFGFCGSLGSVRRCFCRG